jgi:hypothetical protein
VSGPPLETLRGRCGKHGGKCRRELVAGNQVVKTLRYVRARSTKQISLTARLAKRGRPTGEVAERNTGARSTYVEGYSVVNEIHDIVAILSEGVMRDKIREETSQILYECFSPVCSILNAGGTVSRPQHPRAIPVLFATSPLRREAMHTIALTSARSEVGPSGLLAISPRLA